MFTVFCFSFHHVFFPIVFQFEYLFWSFFWFIKHCFLCDKYVVRHYWVFNFRYCIFRFQEAFLFFHGFQISIDKVFPCNNYFVCLSLYFLEHMISYLKSLCANPVWIICGSASVSCFFPWSWSFSLASFMTSNFSLYVGRCV